MLECPFPKSTGKNVLFILQLSYIRPISKTHMQFWPENLSFRFFEVNGQIRFFI